MQTTCSLCGELRPDDRVIARGVYSICADCIWRLVDELETRGQLPTEHAELTARRPTPCTLCARYEDGVTVVGDVHVCIRCGQAIAHLVLSSSRAELEDIWGIELTENTRMRKATEVVAVELKEGGRVHAQLALELAGSGELGQALIEASIALISAPDDRRVVEPALRVLLGANQYAREHGMAVTTPLTLIDSLKRRLPTQSR